MLRNLIGLGKRESVPYPPTETLALRGADQSPLPRRDVDWGHRLTVVRGHRLHILHVNLGFNVRWKSEDKIWSPRSSRVVSKCLKTGTGSVSRGRAESADCDQATSSRTTGAGRTPTCVDNAGESRHWVRCWPECPGRGIRAPSRRSPPGRLRWQWGASVKVPNCKQRAQGELERKERLAAYAQSWPQQEAVQRSASISLPSIGSVESSRPDGQEGLALIGPPYNVLRLTSSVFPVFSGRRAR